MKNHAEMPVPEEVSPEANSPVFRLFAVYDTNSAGASAEAASEFVLNELGEDVPVEKQFCDASALASPSGHQDAVQKAASADMLIIALSSPRAVENSIRQWAREWPQNRRQDGGLLAVLPQQPDPSASADLVEFLRETAISANMDFLCRSHNRHSQ